MEYGGFHDASRRSGGRRVRAVDHAIDVLEALASSPRSLSLSDIARKVGLSKATTHHLLATLESRRCVIRDPDSPRYRLSWALYELGSNVVRNVSLPRVARPYLDQLAIQTGESCLLGILDSGSVLYLDRSEPPQGLRMTADAGRRGSLHATASGKVLLAYAVDKQVLDDILAGPLQRFTRYTITDPEQLRRELDQARTLGYATCWREAEPDLSSIAVPLRDYTGAVVGSLTLAAPYARLNPQTFHDHLRPLQTAAHHIELHLGGARPARHGKSSPG